MVFITTGQRIATENFADGVIYKVTFVDTTISYMMCVGIGQDFVMLQGPNPSLFCLTMSSASRVSTIDVHDPTPPEPPTPIENALQYQNGVPPFTFTTTTSKLFSWYIEGPCGEETANLLFKKIIDCGINPSGKITEQTGVYNVYVAKVAEGDIVTVSNFAEAYAFYGSEPSISSTSIDNTRYITYDTPYTITIPNGAEYIAVRAYAEQDNTMLNTGSTPLPYEPYGYKIPISCNSNLTTIYLDAALGEGEKLYSVNIDTEITTDIGENTLTVDTTDTPTMQIVYDIYAEG